MITVLLAEKDDQAATYAAALGEGRKKGMTWIVQQSPYLEGEIHIVAAEGHLFEYEPPNNNWDLEKLPLLDVSFKQHLKDDKKSKNRFNVIYQEVKKSDRVLIGTDSDREGERIAYSILSHIPGGKEKIWKRLWVHSMTTKGLQRSFQNLRDPTETYNYYLEAEARAQSDWLVGMNLSPFVTLSLQHSGKVLRKKENLFSVGRVQTPTVRILCENDISIRNFVPQTYWKLQLEDKQTGIVFSNSEPYYDSEEVFKIARNLSEISTVSSIESEEHVKAAPPLFCLSDLQGYAAKRWKFDASMTEQLVERLYLKKYLSYPRTDSRYITQEEFDYLSSNITAYQHVLQYPFEVAHPEARKNYVNPEKIGENSHYALIPTEKIPDLLSLTAQERLIYEAVTRRTILMFAEDCRYETTTVQLKNQGLEFVTRGRRMVRLGWGEWANQTIRKDVFLPHYQVDQKVPSIISVCEEVTKPPKRITESQLIGSIFSKYGLGTPATKAAIIQTIQDRGYVTKDKKTGQFTPTNKAYLLINFLYDNEFSNPETTGGWENFLSQIGEGKINPREFVDAIKEKLKKQIVATEERGESS